ncbi:hypothetical protein MCOR07_004617 [Pyricularia oryzae]|nr:hypothetical protein MCOR07_004617 [Pyricularia oryzae]
MPLAALAPAPASATEITTPAATAGLAGKNSKRAQQRSWAKALKKAPAAADTPNHHHSHPGPACRASPCPKGDASGDRPSPPERVRRPEDAAAANTGSGSYSTWRDSPLTCHLGGIRWPPPQRAAARAAAATTTTAAANNNNSKIRHKASGHVAKNNNNAQQRIRAKALKKTNAVAAATTTTPDPPVEQTGRPLAERSSPLREGDAVRAEAENEDEDEEED